MTVNVSVEVHNERSPFASILNRSWIWFNRLTIRSDTTTAATVPSTITTKRGEAKRFHACINLLHSQRSRRWSSGCSWSMVSWYCLCCCCSLRDWISWRFCDIARIGLAQAICEPRPIARDWKRTKKIDRKESKVKICFPSLGVKATLSDTSSGQEVGYLSIAQTGHSDHAIVWPRRRPMVSLALALMPTYKSWRSWSSWSAPKEILRELFYSRRVGFYSAVEKKQY